MKQESSTAAGRFLDEVEATLRASLRSLDDHESRFEADTGMPGQHHSRAETTLGHLEGNLTEWQNLIGDMAEKAQIAADELGHLDTDLTRALSAFTVARRFLQPEISA